MYLAQNMKYLRTQAGETQKDIASLLGVTEMTVSRYESGANEPDLNMVIAIAGHYEVSVDELLLDQIFIDKPLHVKNIRFLRKKNNLTQLEIADLLGVRQSTVSLYEICARRIEIDYLVKLADFFGVTLDQLVRQDLTGGE